MDVDTSQPEGRLGQRIRQTALVVTVGLMLISLLRERLEDKQFEKIVTDTFHTRLPVAGMLTSQANALLLLHQVHTLVNANSRLMGSNRSMEGKLLWSPGEHLIHPGGACGSYSTVLAKTLQTAGFQVRKIGLASAGTKAIHHVMETLADDHWVLLDAPFDLAYHRPDGHLASAKEVAANWAFYQRQTPSGYPAEYDYSGYYYTNWDRLPGANTLFHYWPALPVWLKAHEVSLRFLFLNTWNCLAGFWAMIAFVLLATDRRTFQGTRKMSPVEGSLANEPLASPSTSRVL